MRRRAEERKYFGWIVFRILVTAITTATSLHIFVEYGREGISDIWSAGFVLAWVVVMNYQLLLTKPPTRIIIIIQPLLSMIQSFAVLFVVLWKAPVALQIPSDIVILGLSIASVVLSGISIYNTRQSANLVDGRTITTISIEGGLLILDLVIFIWDLGRTVRSGVSVAEQKQKQKQKK